VLVCSVFFALGKLELGRVVYFFPSHVLVGCIGGIGVFIAVTSISVTNKLEFTFDMDGVQGFIDNFHLFGVVVFFQATLRLLDWALLDTNGHPRFTLLAQFFLCHRSYLLRGLVRCGRERGLRQADGLPSSRFGCGSLCHRSRVDRALLYGKRF
jgi:hypothetical protein